MAQPLSLIRNSLVRRQLYKLSLLVMLVSIGAIVWSADKLYQAHQYNQHLASKKIINQVTPQALLLNASIYTAHGLDDKALATYAQLAARGDAKLAAVAYFNSGNSYLKQATDVLERETLMGWDTAGPLLALAKNSYRHALNLDSSWSEAKYNFELALRLSPANHGRKGPQEYEREEDKVEDRPSGWPAIPGSPRGMP